MVAARQWQQHDGKAGSLVDDRGHFYKPLQRGPRGDRELAFYDAIEETLLAEAAALPAAAAPAGQAQAPPQWAAHSPTCGSPAHASATYMEGSFAGEADVLPWKSSCQLRKLFPSFKDTEKERGPMEVTQRDELGLLSSGAISRLSLGGSSSAQTVQQQHQADPKAPHGKAAAAAAAESRSRESDEGEEDVDDPLFRYGKSPDSDDCAEHTGRHLMQAFHDGGCGGIRGPQHGSGSRTSNRSSQVQAAQAGRQPGEAAAPNGQQQHQGEAAGMLQQAALPAAAANGCLQPWHEQQWQGVAPAGVHCTQPPQPQPQMPPQRVARSSWEHRHTTAHAEEAYTRPEHAQVAALLGQPVYDPSLSAGPVGGSSGGDGFAGPPLVLPSTSRPPRSPFMSELLHHTHPPGPQEQLRSHSAAAAAAAAGPMCSAASSLYAASEGSSEAYWVPSEGEDEEGEGEGKAGLGRTSSSGRAFGSLPFYVRNAPLLRVIPKYYGTAQHSDGRTLLELEDLARAYRHPCIMDVKIGFRTWYPEADAKYIQRCKEKDESTTQAALGFKICGMQVFRHGAGGYWRASKRWCKTLPLELVDKALLSFAHNEHGLRPSDVYGGPAGAIAQLEALESWFAVQRDFHFYSSSVLILYEGGAASPEGAKVRVRLVDFAHTFFLGGQAEGGCAEEDGMEDGGVATCQEKAGNGCGTGGKQQAQQGRQQRRCRDANFLAGLRALLARLRGVVHAQLQVELT